MSDTREAMKREPRKRKYPKCSSYRDGRHRFGMHTLSFADVCMYRDKDIENICKCGFERKAVRP